MGINVLKIGVKLKRIGIFFVGTCFRSFCYHPFFVGMVLLLIFIYRSFPFIFSLLLYASPILVSTFILLGTLLVFGQPNTPEIDREEKTNHEFVPLKTRIFRDETVTEKDENIFMEKYSFRGKHVIEKSMEPTSPKRGIVSEFNKSCSSFSSELSPIEENSQEMQVEKHVIEEAESELHSSSEIDERHGKEECLGFDHPYSQIKKTGDEDIEQQHCNNENIESRHVKSPVESIDSYMADRAGSSPESPWKPGEEEDGAGDDEASDIVSDQAESSSRGTSVAGLIPMLDELHPLLDEGAPQPTPNPDDGSDTDSGQSCNKSSNGTIESDEDSVNPEEETDYNDDEDGKTKSAIQWTEDDQKNLMDLKTLELERNQRLENLIARRNAWRMMNEKNLIDLESSDPSFNIPPVSTRQNPFDSPSCNDGLPSIPGSAPSILVPRRNPFDLPYDSGQENDVVTEESFQQEFGAAFPPKDIFHRRHESFNAGPSIFGPPKQQNIDFKPYFVAELMASEVGDYSSLPRQSSDLSDSKASSAPETESISSAEVQSDNKLNVEKNLSQEADENEDAVEIGHPSVPVGHGSESSGDEDAVELGQPETGSVEIKLGEVESETKDIATTGEQGSGEISRSSSSWSSKAQEGIFYEKEDESPSRLAGKGEDNITQGSTSVSLDQASAEKSEFDGQHKDGPIYDSSPTAFQKNLSSSDIPEMVQISESLVDGDSEERNQSVQMNEYETETSEGEERNETVVLNQEVLVNDQKSEGENTFTEAESFDDDSSNVQTPFSDAESTEENLMNQDRSDQNVKNEAPSSSQVGEDVAAPVTSPANKGMFWFMKKPTFF
ncbi:hypothetical protein NMG60_11018892 [Bertholletia excelsa]